MIGLIHWVQTFMTMQPMFVAVSVMIWSGGLTATAIQCPMLMWLNSNDIPSFGVLMMVVLSQVEIIHFKPFSEPLCPVLKDLLCFSRHLFNFFQKINLGLYH